MKKRLAFLYLGLVVVVAIISVAILWGKINVRRNSKSENIPTAKVEKGELTVSLAINGILESTDQTPVRSDIRGVLISVCKNNSAVEVGDFVFELDTKELELQRDKLI